eukprot:scaffold1734_cov113-Isochrysis_galbana.AAC.3
MPIPTRAQRHDVLALGSAAGPLVAPRRFYAAAPAAPARERAPARRQAVRRMADDRDDCRNCEKSASRPPTRPFGHEYARPGNKSQLPSGRFFAMIHRTHTVCFDLGDAFQHQGRERVGVEVDVLNAPSHVRQHAGPRAAARTGAALYSSIARATDSKSRRRSARVTCSTRSAPNRFPVFRTWAVGVTGHVVRDEQLHPGALRQVDLHHQRRATQRCIDWLWYGHGTDVRVLVFYEHPAAPAVGTGSALGNGVPLERKHVVIVLRAGLPVPPHPPEGRAPVDHVLPPVAKRVQHLGLADTGPPTNHAHARTWQRTSGRDELTQVRSRVGVSSGSYGAGARCGRVSDGGCGGSDRLADRGRRLTCLAVDWPRAV